MKRLADNKPITGSRAVADILGEPVVECLKKWLKLKDTAGQPALKGNDDDTTMVLVSLAEVKPESVKWLRPARIPLGKLTIIEGDPEGFLTSVSRLVCMGKVVLDKAWRFRAGMVHVDCRRVT